MMMMIVTFEFFIAKIAEDYYYSDVSSGVDHDTGTIIMMKIIH